MRVAWLVVLVACSRAPSPSAWPSGPFVRVTVHEPQATAAQLESTVATPLEAAIGAPTRTTIRPGIVTIDVASRDPGWVREAIARHLAELPRDIAPPLVQIEQPVELCYAVRSTTDSLDVLEKRNAQIVRQLQERVHGLGRVELCEYDRVRAVHTDAERLRAFGVTDGDVANALSAAGGEVSDRTIGTRDGAPIRVRDVAMVAEERRPTGCAADVPTIIGKIRGTADPRELTTIVKSSGLDAIFFQESALYVDGDRWTLLAPDADQVVGIAGANRADLEVAAATITKALGAGAGPTLGVAHERDPDTIIPTSPPTILHGADRGPEHPLEFRRVDREPWVGVLVYWGTQGVAEKLAKVQLPTGVRWRIEKRSR